MIDGHKLRRIRVMRGLSQAALAKLIGTDQDAISEYERGVRQPQPRTLLKLAQALRVDPERLMDDE